MSGQGAVPLKSAWLAGPALIRRAPLAFAVWTLWRMAGRYASSAVILAVRGAGGGLESSAVWGAVIALPFEAVLMTAVLRGCLGQGEPRRAFLGLGLAEAKMAGLILLAGLAGMLIALPSSLAAAYVGYFLRQKLLAASALGLGAAVSALVLMRLAPLPAVLVDRGRLDIGAALGASRGRYLLLAGSVLGAAVLERLAQYGPRAIVHPPGMASWTAAAAPLQLGMVAWDSLTDVAALAFMAGVATTAWRAPR